MMRAEEKGFSEREVCVFFLCKFGIGREEEQQSSQNGVGLSNSSLSLRTADWSVRVFVVPKVARLEPAA